MAQKGINLMIYDFKSEIVKMLNDSILPISIKRQIFEEILSNMQLAEEKVIQEERAKYQEALKEDEKKKGEQNNVYRNG